MNKKTIDRFLDECGITPGIFVYEKDGESGEGFVILKDRPKIAMACYVSECDGHLYSASREMLKALIESTLFIEKIMYDVRPCMWSDVNTQGYISYESGKTAILAALPGKTWQDIKKRLEEIYHEI